MTTNDPTTEDRTALSVLAVVQSLADRVAAGELVYAPACPQCGHRTNSKEKQP